MAKKQSKTKASVAQRTKQKLVSRGMPASVAAKFAKRAARRAK